jgi:hypothetical protein
VEELASATSSPKELLGYKVLEVAGLCCGYSRKKKSCLATVLPGEVRVQGPLATWEVSHPADVSSSRGGQYWLPNVHSQSDHDCVEHIGNLVRGLHLNIYRKQAGPHRISSRRVKGRRDCRQ